MDPDQQLQTYEAVSNILGRKPRESLADAARRVLRQRHASPARARAARELLECSQRLRGDAQWIALLLLQSAYLEGLN